MPKGIPKYKEAKVEEVKKEEVIGHDNLEGEPIVKKKQEEIKHETQEKKEEKLLPRLDKLDVGQAYFEAPDGHLIIGEANRDKIWDHRGKGQWILKKR